MNHQLIPAFDDDVTPFFAGIYGLPSMRDDLTRWDWAWERVLRNLSAPNDVWPVVGHLWKLDILEDPMLALESKLICDSVRHFQGKVAAVEKEFDGHTGRLAAGWVLLNSVDRRRHLLSGIKRTCQTVTIREDTRALCPEITTRAMLKQNGKAFTDFALNLAKGIREAGPGNMYFLQTEWWLSMPQPWSEDTQFSLTQLTLHRNEFIAAFVMHTAASFGSEVSDDGPGSKEISDVMNSDLTFGMDYARKWASMPKPRKQCENCNRTRGEIRRNRFMVCSNCKFALDFSLHYCSRSCQKENWANHKKNCGKKKVSRNIPDTDDAFWWAPDLPHSLRFAMMTPDGPAIHTSFGFGTPSRDRRLLPDLQRQIVLLYGDKEAEYFLFDDADQPIRITIGHTFTRIMFRSIRSRALFDAVQRGAEWMAAYLIETVGHRLGLSRRTILEQFTREYGQDIPEKVALFEAKMNEDGRYFWLSYRVTARLVVCLDHSMPCPHKREQSSPVFVLRRNFNRLIDLSQHRQIAEEFWNVRRDCVSLAITVRRTRHESRFSPTPFVKIIQVKQTVSWGIGMWQKWLKTR